MKKIIFILFLLGFYFGMKAAAVDSIFIYSTAMNKNIKCVVIKPSSYKKKKNKFATVYLLHGWSGKYSDWIIKVPELKQYADEYQLLIICPDGNYNSWYFDSPVNDKIKYETYISTEVPHYIDSAYKTIADKNHRGITGLSMGGHGALFIGWHHPQIFSAAGSMSGGVDLNESKNKFDIIKVLGDTLTHADNWRNYSVINVVESKLNDSLALIIDCGVNDIFIAGNRALNQKLSALKIRHEYIERPGQHNWDYWKYAVHFQLLFFKKFFEKHSSEW